MCVGLMFELLIEGGCIFLIGLYDNLLYEKLDNLLSF